MFFPVLVGEFRRPHRAPRRCQPMRVAQPNACLASETRPKLRVTSEVGSVTEYLCSIFVIAFLVVFERAIVVRYDTSARR